MSGRGRGLGAVLGLAAISAVPSAAQAGLLILVPFAVLLVALPPYRPWRMGLGAAGAALLVSGPAGPVADFGRGWALVLGGWFAMAIAWSGERRFLSRGLLALAGTVLTTALFFVVNPGSFTVMDRAVRLRLEEGAAAFLALRGEAVTESLEQALQQGAAFQALLYPALFAIASLAGLAVAWWLYRRLVAPDSDGAIGALRDFRFSDGLVWLLIAGLALVLAPAGELLERAGANVLAFMAALYALRGVAVMTVLAAGTGTLGLVLAVVVAVLLYPLTLMVGLSDMWLDLRSRRRAAPPPGP